MDLFIWIYLQIPEHPGMVKKFVIDLHTTSSSISSTSHDETSSSISSTSHDETSSSISSTQNGLLGPFPPRCWPEIFHATQHAAFIHNHT